MMIYSTVFTERTNDQLQAHLIRDDDQENLCFALYNPSEGRKRFSGIIDEIIMPEDGDHQVHYNASFNPQYLERVLQLALEKGKGIAFLHSHLYPGWQGMSPQDVVAEQKRIAPQAYAITHLPLLGLTVGNDGSWSARFWLREKSKKYCRKWCEKVRIVGRKLSLTYDDNQLPIPVNKEELLRTISAWGEQTQADLARLRIGIVGVGSVGSIVAESLARMGIQHIHLFDFDIIERKNRDRTLGTRETDIGRPKVEVIADSIGYSATADDFMVELFQYSICEKEGFRASLDCDLLFSCVDRPWPRFVLNFIAYAHLIPVIDGGIRVETNWDNSKIKRADWRIHTVCPTRPCMECIGQYKSEDVSMEKAGLLDDPEYIKNLSKDHSIHHSENVFGFSLSLASLEIQQFLSLVISPCNHSISPKMYHFVTGCIEDMDEKCLANCYISNDCAGKGDCAPIKVTAKHEIAEKIRQHVNYKKVPKSSR